jgi:hypothetical protein
VFLAKVLVWPYYNIFIYGIFSSVMVLSAGQLIYTICSAWFVFKEHVILLAFQQISGNSWTDFPGVLIVA